jgi:LCP family protein required for cell wall assembly
MSSGSTSGSHPSSRSSGSRLSSKKKKHLSLPQKLALGFGIPLGLIAIVVGVLLIYINSINASLAVEEPERKEQLQRVLVAPEKPSDPLYILVLGSDARPADTASRSDTIMLCRLDPNTKEVSILSVPRDTKVEIDGYGTQKINAAYAFGAEAGAVEAVSEFANAPINHFAAIDFEGFKGIVDVLGGVTVNVPEKTTFGNITLEPGIQTLDGDQSLAFVRCRMSYTLGDFQRAANQRQFLKAVLTKVLDAPINEIPGLLGSLANCLTTDLTVTDLIALAMDYRGMDTDGFYTGQVPATTQTIDGVSYVITLEDQWAAMRTRFKEGGPFNQGVSQPDVIE